jgi:hypothetical protein
MTLQVRTHHESGFARFLGKNVKDAGELRDHIEECLRTSGDQFNRALQVL